MEIFSEEFKNLLSTQLEELTNVVKTEKSKENPDVMSNEQLIEAMEDCFKNPYGIKKEKKKKNKKFKVGDVVYWGEREGIVTDKHKEKDEVLLYVSFKQIGLFRSWELYFTEDGRFFFGTPIVLSHFPYELKMKKIK